MGKPITKEDLIQLSVMRAELDEKIKIACKAVRGEKVAPDTTDLDTSMLGELDSYSVVDGLTRVACRVPWGDTFSDSIAIFVERGYFRNASSACCVGDVLEFADAYQRMAAFIRANGLIQGRPPQA